MKYEIEYATNPIRKTENTIDLTVKFAGINEEIPFTACSGDVEEHGRILYQNAVNGDYGEIIDEQGE